MMAALGVKEVISTYGQGGQLLGGICALLLVALKHSDVCGLTEVFFTVVWHA
jgi:hypothetical protein